MEREEQEQEREQQQHIQSITPEQVQQPIMESETKDSSLPSTTTSSASIYDSLMAELDARVATRIATGAELPAFCIGKSPPARRISTRKPQTATFSRFDAVHRRTQQKQKSIVEIHAEREKMKAKLSTVSDNMFGMD